MFSLPIPQPKHDEQLDSLAEMYSRMLINEIIELKTPESGNVTAKVEDGAQRVVVVSLPSAHFTLVVMPGVEEKGKGNLFTFADVILAYAQQKEIEPHFLSFGQEQSPTTLLLPTKYGSISLSPQDTLLDMHVCGNCIVFLVFAPKHNCYSILNNFMLQNTDLQLSKVGSFYPSFFQQKKNKREKSELSRPGSDLSRPGSNQKSRKTKKNRKALHPLKPCISSDLVPPAKLVMNELAESPLSKADSHIEIVQHLTKIPGMHREIVVLGGGCFIVYKKYISSFFPM